MRKTILPFVAALPGVLLGQGKSAADAAAANNAFACELYRTLAASDGNLFFSPYSISAALAMTRTGAGGRTATQMDAVLHTEGLAVGAGHRELAAALAPPKIRRWFGEKTKMVPAYDLRIANALWGQEGFGFEPAFVTSLDREFGAPLQRIDFGQAARARKLINGWVEDNTNGKIKDLVPPGLPKPETRLVLANAIYFKADWNSKFEKRATKTEPFAKTAGEKIRVRMMRNDEYMKYGETDDVQLVELPYDGRHLAMLVALPKKRGNLKAVEAKLTSETMADWQSRLKSRRVQLKLPRFEFTSKADLTEVLPLMGMKDAFDPERADFSGMTKEEPLFIGAVLHKAFVAVDENGTEAAAATAVMMEVGSAARPATPVPFIADHPFLFLVRHEKTGCVLFLGRVTAPTPAAK